MKNSIATDAFSAAFNGSDVPFLFHYRVKEAGDISRTVFSRGDFFQLSRQAAGVLRNNGCKEGGRVLHCFGANEWEDLVFRFGAWMIGAVPVTVNWQADPPERVFYKLEKTGAGVVLYKSPFDPAVLAGLREKYPHLSFIDAGVPGDSQGGGSAVEMNAAGDGTVRMTIFTSGTTGAPKGVMLTEGNYAVNRKTFEKMLGILPADRFAVLIVNPLHHTNSTAICDWAIRRPGTHIHLLERYATSYWEILTRVADTGYDRIVAPNDGCGASFEF